MNILKALRVLHGLRQKDLAYKVGRSRSWMSLVESGKLEPQREEAEKIADILGMDLESVSGEQRNLDE